MLGILAIQLDGELLSEAVEALEEFKESASEWVMARALAGRVRRSEGSAGKDAISEALRAALSLKVEEWRVNVLAALMPYLEGTELRMALSEALKAVKSLADDDEAAFSMAGTPQMRVLSKLTPYFQVDELLSDALATVMCVRQSWHRGPALTDLASKLAQWTSTSPLGTTLAWRKALHTIARNPREEFMSDLSALMPFCMALGADQQIIASSIFSSIHDVKEWWP